jgi:PiT family inorganic phosphate transporter
MLSLILSIIIVALVFDFLNGFHDAANSIATIVSTRVLTPPQAVVWAAFFNFVAAFAFGTGVAKTIGTGLIRKEFVDVYVVFGGLMGAILWNIVTWLLALPTSSSHALVSGLAGAAIAKGGLHTIVYGREWALLLGFIVLSPAIGFFLGALNMIVVSWVFRRSTPHKVDTLFRRLQLVSAGIYSLGHGGNDAQKTMGIIAALLFAHGLSGDHFNVPFWVVLACQIAMALGTLFGGWRIVRTMGSRITHLTPVQGVCAETAGAMTLFLATYLGIPVSTTHTITGAIVGVGAARRVSAVRWNVAKDIVVAWLVTMPAAALLGAGFYLIANAAGMT